jgi:hypothetical protein
MEKYMFLFAGGSDTSNLSNEAMEKHMQKWFAWVQKLQKEQRYVSGEALLPGGKHIVGPKKTVTDGPYAEGKEVVGGFFVVLAKDLKEAVEMAKECPDYEMGGVVEVREVQKFDNM